MKERRKAVHSKGATGTSLGGTKINTNVKGSHLCKNCKHFTEGIIKGEKSNNGRQLFGYKCGLTDEKRYYTQYCVCDKFRRKKKEPPKKESIYLN
jgi:hypothetical protein